MDNFYFNDFDIQQQVLDFMIQNGIVPYDSNLYIHVDGKIHRFRVLDEGQNDKSGAYCIFSEHWPAGWVQDWHHHHAVKWAFQRDNLNDEGKSFFDDSRYKEAREKSKKIQDELMRIHEQEQTEASELARVQFQQAKPAPQNHPYLLKKTFLF